MKLQNAASELPILKRDSESQARKIQELRTANDSIATKLRGYYDADNNSQKELNTANRLRKEADDRAEKALKDLAAKKAENSINVSRLNDIRKANESEDSTYTKLQLTYTDLQKSNSDLHSTYTKLETTYTDLQKSNSGLHSTYTKLETTYTKLKATYTELKATYTELESTYIPHIEKMKSQKTLIRKILYWILGLAGVTTGIIFFLGSAQETWSIDIVLMSILFGSMMAITTFFTNHLKKWQHIALILFFCTAEFASMAIHKEIFGATNNEGEMMDVVYNFRWFLHLIECLFLPVTNVILANVIKHIRSGESLY
jgi:predicted  nucleic acid-binding Zn-ribbon protein